MLNGFHFSSFVLGLLLLGSPAVGREQPRRENAAQQTHLVGGEWSAVVRSDVVIPGSDLAGRTVC